MYIFRGALNAARNAGRGNRLNNTTIVERTPRNRGGHAELREEPSALAG